MQFKKIRIKVGIDARKLISLGLNFYLMYQFIQQVINQRYELIA
jgi:hypothetical protein